MYREALRAGCERAAVAVAGFRERDDRGDGRHAARISRPTRCARASRPSASRSAPPGPRTTSSRRSPRGWSYSRLYATSHAMTPLGLSRVAVISKKDQVTKALRDAIVSGRMQPGDAIVESRVARQLGVGQPLVREALLDLEHSGFVQRVPYRGTSVTKLGPEEIDQIQRMRVELEALAVEWARSRVTAADLTELRGLVAQMATSARDGDLARFNDCDLALHRKIWELSGNKYLADALERAVVPLLTFFYLRSGRISELHVHSVEEHEALVEAIAAPGPALPSVRATLASLRDQCQTLVSTDATPLKPRSDTADR